MKKSLLLLALITFSFINAQVKEKGTFEITPKIGTSSFFENNEEESTKYNSGVEFGVTVDYYFNDRWSLRSGLIATKMGGKYKTISTNFDPNVSGNTTTSYEDKLNYLSIPINANWHFGSTRKWNLNFGLSPSFLTSAKFVENGKENKIPTSDIKSFQLGFTYGIGYKIEINKKFGILIDSQFFNGLTNTSTSSEIRIVNAGYSFNIGGVIEL